MAIQQVILTLLVASTLTSMASASSGTATFYTDYIPSACYEDKDGGVMIAAANPSLYKNGAACGKRYKVRCTGAPNKTPKPCRNGTVTVKIVDLCAVCRDKHLDLSQQAFFKIANLDAGIVRIHYTEV